MNGLWGCHTREIKTRVGNLMGKGECESGRSKTFFFYFLTLPGIYLDIGGKEITSSMIAFTYIYFPKKTGALGFLLALSPSGNKGLERLCLLLTLN